MNNQPLAAGESSSQPRPDIDEQLDYQERARKVMRLGWAFMALIVLLGLIGLFGSGPLSKGRISSENGLELTYRKISRYNAPTHFELKVPSSKNPLELLVNVDFLQAIAIEEINPEPKEMVMVGEKQKWLFANEGSSSPTQVEIAFRPDRFGRATADIEVKDAGKISAQQFYLP